MSKFLKALLIVLVLLASGSCRDKSQPAEPDGGGGAQGRSGQPSEEWMEPVDTDAHSAPLPEEWDWEANSSLITDADTVAIVGDKKISRKEFFAELERRYRDTAIRQLIMEAVWNQEAQRNGIEVSEEDARNNMAEIIEQEMERERQIVAGRYGPERTYEEYVKQIYGKSLEEYRDEKVESAMEAGTARLALLVTRLVAFDVLTSGRTKIRHIQCATEQKAGEVLDKIKNGRDTFERLAGQESEDAYTRENGGTMLPFVEGDLAFREDLRELGEEFCKAVSAAPEGLMPNVVKSKSAFHVVEVLEKKRPREVSYRDIADEVAALIDKGMSRTDHAIWQGRVEQRAKVDQTERDGVVATVNSKEITTAALRKYLTERFGTAVAVRLVEDILIRRFIAATGLTNSEEETEKMAARIAEEAKRELLLRIRYELPPYRAVPNPLETYLRNQENMTVEQYTKQLIERSIKDGSAESRLTVAKISAYYLLTTEHISIQHILFETVHKAKAAWYKLKTEADFDLLAKKESILDEALPGGKTGELLPFNRQEYSYRDDINRYGRVFLDAAYSTKKDCHSGVFKSNIGWHIIRVLDRWPARPDAKYETLKDKITDEVFGREDERWMIYRPSWAKQAAKNTGVAIKLPEKFD
ncbi:MAG: peptidylprolyl isomerase [Planctomycetota bacterium]